MLDELFPFDANEKIYIRAVTVQNDEIWLQSGMTHTVPWQFEHCIGFSHKILQTEQRRGMAVVGWASAGSSGYMVQSFSSSHAACQQSPNRESDSEF